MALTIYPTDNYDSYVSLLDAESIYDTNIIDTSKWDALTDTLKEKYLRQATMLIKLKITDPLEEATPFNLQLATVYLVDYALDTNVLKDDGKGNLKRIKIEGAIEKEFFSRSNSNTAIPDHIAMLLNEYGYLSNSTFSLERV